MTELKKKTKLFGKDILSLEERVILRADPAVCIIFESHLPDHISKITGGQYIITSSLKKDFEDFATSMNRLFVNFENVGEIDELKTKTDIIAIEHMMTRSLTTTIDSSLIKKLKQEIFLYYLCKLEKKLQKQIVFRIFRDFRDEVFSKDVVTRYFR